MYQPCERRGWPAPWPPGKIQNCETSKRLRSAMNIEDYVLLRLTEKRGNCNFTNLHLYFSCLVILYYEQMKQSVATWPTLCLHFSKETKYSYSQRLTISKLPLRNSLRLPLGRQRALFLSLPSGGRGRRVWNIHVYLFFSIQLCTWAFYRSKITTEYSESELDGKNSEYNIAIH